MAKSFKFEENNNNVVYLPPNDGSYETSYGDLIEYCIDRGDNAVRLEVDGWLRLGDIDDMIAFLQAAKQELTK